MEVTVAKSAGFCFGVKRAVDTVYREIESGEKPVYTFGPIIHNEQVVEDLENRGVQVIHSEDELEGLSGGTVVIRSHGVSRDVCEKIEARGMKIVDATCPFVKKIHRIVEEYSRKGYHILVVGNEQHPEVQGIIGWIEGDRFSVISSEEDAQAFAYRGKYYLLTTDNLGGNTGVYGDLILWESTDGLRFKLADAKIAMGNIFDYWKGNEQDRKRLFDNQKLFIRDYSGKLERPAVLFIKGKPAYLYAAADVNISGGSVAESYVFKIEWKTKK